MIKKRVKISEISPNQANPRYITDDKFDKLVKSLKEFPEMMNLRPIVVNTDMTIIGGNMRFKAMQKAGLKECEIIVADLTHEQQREFIIKDNVGFGEWEWETLANDWDAKELDDWGLDLPNIDSEPDFDDLIGEQSNKAASIKITFESVSQLQKAQIDIQELLDRKYPNAYFSVSAGEI